MQSGVRQVSVGPEHRIYSAEILCKDQQIEALGATIKPLLSPGSYAGRPEFFLASISPKVWTPQIIAVTQPSGFLGALYAKERKFAGVPTGIIYGDATLTGMVTAEPAKRGAVFHAAIDALLKRKRTLGLRLLLPPDGYELESLRSVLRQHKVDYTAVSTEKHLVLPLDRSYDEFLEHLGPRTRRNFRYYRRKLEAEGHTYVEDVPAAEFREAAKALLQQKVVGADGDGMARALAMFAQTRHPILAGLRHKDGTWLSLLGGWFEGGRPIIFFQMNSDKHHSRSSLCLVLRGYFFESLIEKGVRSVVFWAGVGEPLNRYCRAIPTLSVYIDKRQKLWSGFRHLIANGVRKLPRDMAWRAEWIVPDGQAVAQSRGHGIATDIE